MIAMKEWRVQTIVPRLLAANAPPVACQLLARQFVIYFGIDNLIHMYICIYVQFLFVKTGFLFTSSVLRLGRETWCLSINMTCLT